MSLLPIINGTKNDRFCYFLFVRSFSQNNDSFVVFDFFRRFLLPFLLCTRFKTHSLFVFFLLA